MIKFIGKNEFALSRYKELYLETFELMKDNLEENKENDFNLESISEVYIIIDEEAKSKKIVGELKTEFNLDMDKIIHFEDENLKNRLLKQLEKSKSEEIRIKDAISVFNLNLSQGSIRSLKGLEYFLNLESLYLYSNKVEDLGALSNLKNLVLVQK